MAFAGTESLAKAESGPLKAQSFISLCKTALGDGLSQGKFMFPSHSRALPLFSELEESVCDCCHLHPLIDPHLSSLVHCTPNTG